jgi:hypothetical protein
LAGTDSIDSIDLLMIRAAGVCPVAEGALQMRFTGSDPSKHSSDPNKLFGRSWKEKNQQSIQTNILPSRVIKVGISHLSKYFLVKSIHTELAND